MREGKKTPVSTPQLTEVEDVLNGFAEAMSLLMIDNHQAAVVRAPDLTLVQGQVLRVLRRGPLATGKLALELRMSASAVTQLTDRLIKKGLIERQFNEGDRRSILVQLSIKGKRLVDGFRKRRTRLFGDALELLDKKERANVLHGMKLLIKAVENYRETNNERDGLSTRN